MNSMHCLILVKKQYGIRGLKYSAYLPISSSLPSLYPWEDAGRVTTTVNPMADIDSKLKRR